MLDTTAFDDLQPPATLTDARELRDGLARLLAQERVAAAAFLEALASFDARRAWEPLGHASLFTFLHRELGLSKGAAYLRFTAVRLVRRFPEVAESLRSGRLCLSAVGELARVMTPENRAEVLPRFFGCSSREAREVAAALAPRAGRPLRELVTRLPLVTGRRPPPDGAAQAPGPEASHPACGSGGFRDAAAGAEPSEHRRRLPEEAGAGSAASQGQGAALEGARAAAPPAGAAVRAHELALPRHARVSPGRECEPLDADLRRLHLTVSRTLLSKLEAARDGLSHVLPGATTEQVLEAALDLLLREQARARKLTRGAADRRARRARRPRRDAAAPEGGALAPASACEGRGGDTSTEAALPDGDSGSKAVPRSDGAVRSEGAGRSGDAARSEGAGRSGGAVWSGDAARSEGAARSDGVTGLDAEAGPDGDTGPDGESAPVGGTGSVSTPAGAKDAARARGRLRAIPAAVERAVRLRDGGRCQFPLDSGGVCGSTRCLQLDHVVPVALGGQATVENLRLLCASHNRYAARLALGEGVMATARRRHQREDPS